MNINNEHPLRFLHPSKHGFIVEYMHEQAFVLAKGAHPISPIASRIYSRGSFQEMHSIRHRRLCQS